jgi:hypothetical protein
MKLFLLAICTGFWFVGCASFPPLTVGAGFMGADVHVSTPGWSAPVPVVASPDIAKPTLLVPATSPAASQSTAIVAPTATTAAGSVPVVVSPTIAQPTLAIPAR